MQIKILWVGKTKNAAIKSLWTEYLERLRHLVSCEIVEIRDLSKVRGLRGARLRSAEGAVLEEALSPKGRLVVLDAKGKEFSSEEFRPLVSEPADPGSERNRLRYRGRRRYL